MNTIIFDFYNTLYNPKTGRLFYGCRTLLSALSQKYTLFLITTSSPEREELIKSFRINLYFKKILICSQKTVQIFKSCISSPSQTLIIGDRLNSEISIGIKQKTLTLRVNPDFENPVLTINNFLKL